MRRSTAKTQFKLGGLLSLLLLAAVTVQSATPVADYQARVTRAAILAQALTEQAPLSQEQILQLQALKQLLPAQEEIEADGKIIQTDNRWLHDALDALKTDSAAQTQNAATLTARLNGLHERLTLTPGTTTTTASAERLAEILARPEYQTAQRQKSKIKEWLDKIQTALRDLFMRLFSNAPRNPAQPSQYTLNLTRLFILTFLALAFCYALFKLVPRWWQRRRRRTKPEPAGTREILGETFDEAATTEDLLASARALAQQGDFRAAIRRAYIALLHELEQQGKLRLHQAKTNRDYLEALRNEQTVYLSFVALTRIFERIWYGHSNATEFDFEGFLTGYHETLKQD